MPQSHARRRFVWITTSIYWIALFVATHLPRRRLPDVDVGDKLSHFIAYGILGVLLYASLTLSERRRRTDVAVLVLLIGMIYGALDEWLQMLPFVKRICELNDWFADVAGLAAGVVLMSLVQMWTRGASVGDRPESR